MHLKTLTMRGFKSFASATTFEFEPGVTAVVGPNGSGKSNVVDALAWVMGEQGAKTLRGGKMEDVIFAGTSGRPALGRAQVSLTIDNSDGALPIDYSEVTISRTLFRSGGSEYAINNTSCRLLDIQELLSDSGLGREMHVIVGQGQLDRILHAGADERRGFVEEAAGILKHRRRKEKTLRKLEAMQANLSRLNDLTVELGRQLGPLGKQAAVARRARQVQADVRDARARLLADDLVTLTRALEQESADEDALRERRDAAARLLSEATARQTALETAVADAGPRVAAARDTWYSLVSVQERLRSLRTLAEERRRLLALDVQEPAAGRDPEQLESQAARIRAAETALEAEVSRRRTELDAAVEARTQAESAAAGEDRRVAGLLQAAADRRESLARLAGQEAAARSRVEAAEAEAGRLRTSIEAAGLRLRQAEEEFAALEDRAAGAEESEGALDAEYEEASTALAAAEEELEKRRTELRSAEREQERLTARREALAVGLDRRDGTALLLEAGLDGVLAPVADLLTVRPGYERAVAAALGRAAEAVAVADPAAAVAALEHLKNAGAGQVELLLVPGGTAVPLPAGRPDPADDPDRSTGPAAGSDGSGGLPALALVTAAPSVKAAVDLLLADVEVVESLAAAAASISAAPGRTAVTRDGDVLSAFSGRGGSATAPGLIEIQAAVEETDGQLARTAARVNEAGPAIESASARCTQARERMHTALDKLHDSDARLAAAADRLGALGSVLRSAAGEAERLSGLLAAAEAGLAAERDKLAAAGRALAAAREAPEEREPEADRRAGLALAASTARAAETESRLALRSAEEQLKAVSGRAAALERSAQAERRARSQAAERAQRRAGQAARAAAVAAGAERVLTYAAVSAERARTGRDSAEAARTRLEAELAEVRSAADRAAAELARLTDTVHRRELVRAEKQLRIESLEARALEELGLTADVLVAGYGPDQLVPLPEEPVGADKWAALRTPVDEQGNAVVEGTAYNRAEQEKRLKKAERDLASLGRVNPLALEEFAALEERHRFLSTQLEDLRASRKDLLEIIRDVDRRVEEVFSAAFADTAEQFVRVFGTLFPGGEGRLVLTDPSDMLTTGIEIEARPAGKKIKRLSLLSGGERSLTAVALLVAIFKARPSPFYVMDEVEAALDDTNLGRLITIFEELRASSQLIVITHQKRTMEIADALYGVTMRGDGVSTVISQRLEKPAALP